VDGAAAAKPWWSPRADGSQTSSATAQRSTRPIWRQAHRIGALDLSPRRGQVTAWSLHQTGAPGWVWPTDDTCRRNSQTTTARSTHSSRLRRPKPATDPEIVVLRQEGASVNCCRQTDPRPRSPANRYQPATSPPREPAAGASGHKRTRPSACDPDCGPAMPRRQRGLCWVGRFLRFVGRSVEATRRHAWGCWA
jgi:hypothetical protein